MNMGYIRHHAIVVTTWNEDKLAEAHDRATAIGLRPTPIAEHQVNGGGSFLIPPDGSKEGWSDSEEGDNRRAQFRSWLRGTDSSDGGHYIEWVEVAYGNDDGRADIEHSAWSAENTVEQ